MYALPRERVLWACIGVQAERCVSPIHEVLWCEALHAVRCTCCARAGRLGGLCAAQSSRRAQYPAPTTHWAMGLACVTARSTHDHVDINKM